MKILGIIPARYASTRYPGKPLIEIGGKTMIQRVYEKAKTATQLDDVVVATDDERILLCVHDFGGKAILTSDQHQSGTDRCAEVIKKLPGFDVVVNIQGDEPFIDPVQINLLCTCFSDPQTTLATLVKEITSADELFNPNSPKVVLNKASQAIYFSRNPIPYLKGKEQSEWLRQQVYYKHIGIYGYRKDTLLAITGLEVSSLERAEGLEQLRWIENGYSIKVAVTDVETQAVDTPEDLQKILRSGLV
ncbi:3-deoxy-manno-octulosonate cytidylyltransferase [Pedobacter sp. BS3]|uniref:3-deoxy-manno-octulosonate cytidylyltransferase n=1 Tax=Pedobacter sp. BS3 TaxID=2567937 RepID=UPI0011EEA026|nr:3-deoxy-manno-octulosonate cytidylyltransferase [Pedobacter sp. BS3]TZF83670.1 3-deoxy-manno-octulosonate cytidylyltransferase [Pedobacter sp. BS3]